MDGRKLRTPAKQEVVVASELLSHLVAHEWNSQKETMKPFSMPVVRVFFLKKEKGKEEKEKEKKKKKKKEKEKGKKRKRKGKRKKEM